MLDIITKSIYLGSGIASSTKEKVESLVDQLIEKGKLAKEEKSKAVKEIFHTLEKKDKEFEEKAGEFVTEALSEIQVASQKDIKELNKSIADLEKILSAKSNGNGPIQ